MALALAMMLSGLALLTSLAVHGCPSHATPHTQRHNITLPLDHPTAEVTAGGHEGRCLHGQNQLQRDTECLTTATGFCTADRRSRHNPRRQAHTDSRCVMTKSVSCVADVCCHSLHNDPRLTQAQAIY